MDIAGSIVISVVGKLSWFFFWIYELYCPAWRDSKIKLDNDVLRNVGFIRFWSKSFAILMSLDNTLILKREWTDIQSRWNVASLYILPRRLEYQRITQVKIDGVNCLSSPRYPSLTYGTEAWLIRSCWHVNPLNQEPYTQAWNFTNRKGCVAANNVSQSLIENNISPLCWTLRCHQKWLASVSVMGI